MNFKVLLSCLFFLLVGFGSFEGKTSKLGSQAFNPPALAYNPPALAYNPPALAYNPLIATVSLGRETTQKQERV